MPLWVLDMFRGKEVSDQVKSCEEFSCGCFASSCICCLKHEVAGHSWLKSRQNPKHTPEPSAAHCSSVMTVPIMIGSRENNYRCKNLVASLRH